MSQTPQSFGGAGSQGMSALGGRPRLPAVNLIPDSVGESKATRSLQVKGLVAFVVVVAALGAGYASLVFWKAGADERVEAAEAETTRLANEKKKYDEVISVNQQLKDAEAAMVVGTAYELRWSQLLQVMVDTRPDESLVNSISGAGTSATQIISPSEIVLARPGVGRLTVGIRVAQFPDTSEWIRTLNKTPGLEMGSCSAIERLEETADWDQPVYDVACSAEVNLLGLTGKGLPDDFTEWRDKTMAEIEAAAAGGE
ncbi:MAG: hypothetical protein LBO20_10665 [Bifidobacteriaceae bacterium]|nr:hypothetical protein [Bifidobacteriaceae bacterium]